MSRKSVRVGISTKMKSGGIPEPIAAVPGTAAYDYISGRKQASELAYDPRLCMSFDPHDGQPGYLYLFRDRSCLLAPVSISVLTPHEC